MGAGFVGTASVGVVDGPEGMVVGIAVGVVVEFGLYTPLYVLARWHS